MTKKIIKFGRWPSKVSAGFVAGKTLRFQSVQALGNTLYWTESRPEEQGRAVLMGTRLDGQPIELLPSPFSARSKIHEYGGGEFLATDDHLYFINGEDQQIWSVDNSPICRPRQNARETVASPPASKPTQITHTPSHRFADIVFDARHKRLICVAEHHEKDQHHPDNLLVSVSLQKTGDQQITPVLEGNDFYASARLSPDGRQLAFVSWDLPFMPWENATLKIAKIEDDGSISSASIPDSFPNGASFQPEWDAKGHLWFINDETGFGQLYRYDGQKCDLFPNSGAEMGAPLWNLGMKTYGFLNNGQIACFSLTNGQAELSVLDPENKKWFPCQAANTKQSLSAFEQLVTVRDDAKGKTAIAGILSRFDQPDAIASLCLQTDRITTLKSSATFDLPSSDISIAETLEFENQRGQPVYGHYYPPTNQKFTGEQDERPPVILTAHGGPTAFSHAGLKPKVQFWTSRGFGYFDINYSGSWGFGKAYRQRLAGQWGLSDVGDMDAGARYLVEAGLADPKRLLISGSSAGGYTVLMALVNSDLFAAGASYYGISDLARLVDSTHKFEAGYLDQLLNLSDDNRLETLKIRSPLSNYDKITSPVIFFQGLQDKVVPPDQAELMVRALKKKGVEVRYKTFADEGHGFRNQQTIETALTMEYDFYADILGL